MAIKSLLTAVAMGAAALLAAPSASAGDCPARGHHSNWGGHGYSYSYGSGASGHHWGKTSRRHRTDCQRVRYQDYVHGRLAVLSARQCTDRHGRTYIVRGSVRVIAWH